MRGYSTPLCKSDAVANLSLSFPYPSLCAHPRFLLATLRMHLPFRHRDSCLQHKVYVQSHISWHDRSFSSISTFNRTLRHSYVQSATLFSGRVLGFNGSTTV